MAQSIGPARENLAPDQCPSAAAFHCTIGPLAEGGVIFPAPFDLGTAVALADNDTDGSDAVDICDAVSAEVAVRYHVQITQVIDDRPDLRRQVIDTVTERQQLPALLADALRSITTPIER